MSRTLAVLACVIALTMPATSNSRELNLDAWVDRELVPYVHDQLSSHPRFKGETVMFVVFSDDAPAATSNALALGLRDRLLDAAIEGAGISVGWQQGSSSPRALDQSIDCTRDQVHYYVGIEVRKMGARASVHVRALDLEDRNWVSGFGKKWQGHLNDVERQAVQQVLTDRTFTGVRDVPYSVLQSDLLAAKLAHSLSCELLRRAGDDYVVITEGAEHAESQLAHAVELVANNLANHDALQLTTESTVANATLSGKAHLIGGSLHQYWITITPLDQASGLTTVSASAYIELSNTRLAQLPDPRPPPATDTPRSSQDRQAATISIPNSGNDALIGPLRVAASSQQLMCVSGPELSRASFSAGSTRCDLLQTDMNRDAVVFFLKYQAARGMVRLGEQDCRDRTTARLARAGESLNFPIPASAGSRRETAPVQNWKLNPGIDTYFAVAVSDSGAARRIANHLDHLPLSCHTTSRRGLEGDRLNDWLAEFAEITAGVAEHIDWRAIEVNDLL